MLSKTQQRKLYKARIVESRKVEQEKVMLHRTEGNIVFRYPAKVSSLFVYWSGKQRSNGMTPAFMDFYDQLPFELQNEILIGINNNEK